MSRRQFALAIALFSVATLAAAQPPRGEKAQQSPRPAEVQRPAQTKSPQQAYLDGERRMALPKGQPQWSQIIEWFSDQSGLPFVGSGVPNGAFQRTAPEDAAYTCTEAIDIINEALGHIEHTLLRRNGVFTLLPIDGPLDPNLVPFVAPRDLETYGKTEIVRIAVPLKVMNAEEALPKVKQGLGPLGSVVAPTSENHLLVTDSVGKLRRLLRAIQHIEKEEGNSFAHKFIYLRARDAEASVRKLLEELSAAGGLPAAGRALDFDLPLPTAKIRSDERTNTLFISAPHMVIARVVADVRKIDQPQPPVERPFVGPEIRNFDVPAGNAEMFVRILSHLPQFRASPTFRVTAVSPERIVMYGFPEQRLQLEAALLVCLVLPPSISEGAALTYAHGTALAETLSGFVFDSKSPRRTSKTANLSR